MTFGKRVKEARKKAGKSQGDIARHLGYENQAISNWERDITTPNTEVMIEVAKYLDCPFDWLAGVTTLESLDAQLYLVPMEDREFAYEQAKRVINKWAKN
jgi:transcriptional regulator with XRE-family HTH domain